MAQPPQPVFSPSQSSRDLLRGDTKSAGAVAKHGTQTSRTMSTEISSTRAGTGTPGLPRAASKSLSTSVTGASLRTEQKASSMASARAGGLPAAATNAAAVKSTPSHCATNTARGAASVQHPLNRSHRGTTGGRQSPASVGNRRQPRQSLDDGGRQHSHVTAQQKTSDVAADVARDNGESGKDTPFTAANPCDAASTGVSDKQAGINAAPPALKAVRITGCPEAYKRFEEGTFVNYKDVNGKPSYACAFKNLDEDPVHYAFWWAPERKVFMMGPVSASGTMAGFFYVPGDGVNDPTQASMQWVAFDNQSGGWAAFPSMRCVEVAL